MRDCSQSSMIMCMLDRKNIVYNTNVVYNTNIVYNTNVVCVTNRRLVKAYAETAGELDKNTKFAKTYAETTDKMNFTKKKEEMSSFTPFLEKIEEVAKKQPAFIILREKDLPPVTYREDRKSVV